jgi:dTMP kinase
MSGVFIAFEGGEGAGKSTQAAILNDALQREGYRTTLLREPGSTVLGDHLRQFLIGGQPVTPSAELLLFEASRAELMASCVGPLLDAGEVIIADRFAGSTIAYQGYGRGIDLSRIEWLNDFATGGRYPDLTILLDVDPLVGLGRVNSRQLQLMLPIPDDADRFEDETIAFHDAVQRGFREQVAGNPDTWRRIEGNRSIDEVGAAVWRAVCPLLTAKIAAPLAPGKNG